MGERAMALRNGVRRSRRVPAEVYDEPGDTFVATFLGSPPMNLLESGDVIVGFRPEHFLPAHAVTGNRVDFRFCVKDLEYLGSEWILYGLLEGGRFQQKEVIARIPATMQSSFTVDSVTDFAV